MSMLKRKREAGQFVSVLLELVLVIPPIVLAIVGSILIIAWPILVFELWIRIRSAMASVWLRSLGVAVLLFLGLLLYRAKIRLQWAYGVAEIFVGTATCWASLSDTSRSDLLAALGLAGGIYIIVRGCDNFFSAKVGSRIDSNEKTPQRSQGGEIK